jgi:hypothetical protein
LVLIFSGKRRLLLSFCPAEIWADLRRAERALINRGSPARSLPRFLPSDTRLSADLRDLIIDEGVLRSVASRGEAIDVLRARQWPEALAALNSARAALEARLSSLEGSPADLTRDLLARIDRATSPYFD